MSSVVVALGVLASAAMVGVGGPLARKGFLKIGGLEVRELLRRPMEVLPALLKCPELVAGFLLQALSSIPYLVAITAGKVSVVVPMVGVQYIFLVVVAYLLLREKPSKWEGIAILLIAVGVTLLSLTII